MITGLWVFVGHTLTLKTTWLTSFPKKIRHLVLTSDKNEVILRGMSTLLFRLSRVWIRSLNNRLLKIGQLTLDTVYRR